MPLALADGNVNLVIGDAELAELDGALAPLLAEEGARAALLIDAAGKVIASRGDLGTLDPAAIAALAAGNHATTRALARRVGEEDFSLVFQREKFLNVYLCAAASETLLLVLFDEAATLGGVRNKVKQALGPLRRTLVRCARTVTAPAAIARAMSAPEAGEAEGVTAEALRPLGAGESAGPPPELIRRFWRVKTLAEDCIKQGVDRTRSDEWRKAASLVAGVAKLLVEDRFAECASDLATAERTLMQAYERAAGLGRGDEDLRRARGLLQGLADTAAETFGERLGVHASAVLATVDEETLTRYPGVLTDDAPEEHALPPEVRRHRLIRAYLDLLLSRSWVVFKIFGRDAARGLLGRWEAAAEREAALVERLHLKPGLQLLRHEVLKRVNRGVKPAVDPGGEGA